MIYDKIKGLTIWLQRENMEIKEHRQHLSTASLVMIMIVTIMSMAGLVIMAQNGTKALFYYAIVVFLFFIPSSMVFAELGASFPQEGGIYNWVKHAFGKRLGNIALWSQWLGVIFSFPIILSFAISVLLYPFAPQLIHNGGAVLIGSTVLLVIAILASIISIKFSAKISYIGSFATMLIPSVLIISLAAGWLLSGHHPMTPLHFDNIIPQFRHLATFSLLGATVFMFAGIELTANCQRHTKNPRKQYGRAVVIATTIITLLSVLGTLSISILIPAKNTSLIAGLIQAFVAGADAFHLYWLPYVLAVMISFGFVGMLSTYLMSLSQGLLASAKDGLLPRFLIKENSRGIPQRIVLILSLIAIAISFLFICLPSVGATYWTIEAVVVVGNSLRYLLIFPAAIKLRYTEPNADRLIRVPGGNWGMWITAGAAFAISAFATVMTFVPPDQFSIGNPFIFETLLTGGVALFIVLPLLSEWCSKWINRRKG